MKMPTYRLNPLVGDVPCGNINSGLVAPVITEFPGITVGGAIMGGALESSSIRNQHFADALVALEVVLADGRIVQCSSAENADLFFGIRGRYIFSTQVHVTGIGIAGDCKTFCSYFWFMPQLRLNWESDVVHLATRATG